jgi:hypothetical protein
VCRVLRETWATERGAGAIRAVVAGYFEGLDSERGIAWRAADSLALREFLGLGLTETPPDHSTISRTRRLIDLETHQAVFTWVLQVLTGAGLVRGKTIGIDATTLEANAALRSIVRRDNGDTYHAFLTQLAQASGIVVNRQISFERGNDQPCNIPRAPNADTRQSKQVNLARYTVADIRQRVETVHKT